MLCEIGLWGNFWITWGALTAIGFSLIVGMASVIFYYYYQHPTYEMWQQKSNPKYPPAEMVRSEIIQMIKGMLSATLCPSLSLFLAQHGVSKAYCGTGPAGEYGWGYHTFSFLLIWIGVDFWEFFYHRIGHVTAQGWSQHKHHHLFYNPTPFAVIADEYIDQFVRALPLLLFPLVIPINMDLMFFQFGVFFYGYGVYLHWGHEFEYPDAHHPYLNTAFQHYCHHAIATAGKPYHTGFFFKIWDQLFGSTFNDACFCVKCEKAKGKRDVARWEQARKEKPDYSVLLQPSFWLNTVKKA
jgi:lathosterol oxidase